MGCCTRLSIYLSLFPPLTPVRSPTPDKEVPCFIIARCHPFTPSSQTAVFKIRRSCVYSTEITSDPRHLPYSAHWAGQWSKSGGRLFKDGSQLISALAGSKRLTLLQSPQSSQSHSAPSVHSEDEGSVKNPRRPDSSYPLPTNDDFHELSKRSNKALLSALHTLYPRLMGARQWAELNVRP